MVGWYLFRNLLVGGIDEGTGESRATPRSGLETCEMKRAVYVSKITSFFLFQTLLLSGTAR